MRRPVWVLYALIVGLALHNFVMAELWKAGVRGNWLELVSAWKEILLAIGLVLVVWTNRRLPFDARATDWLAAAFGAFVIVYALIPQGWLDGGATHKGVLYGVRHDLIPVAAYFLGRGLNLTVRDLRKLAGTILLTATAVATFGLVDVYLIPFSFWRHSGVPGWYRNLGFDYQHQLGRLPDNFILNLGDEHPIRRLVSTFLSPLATSYLLVVALILMAAWWARQRPHGRLLWAYLPILAVLYAGLLWTHSRSSYLALSFGLLVFAAVRREGRWIVVGAAVASLAIGSVFIKAYPHFAPRTNYTTAELDYQRTIANKPGAETSPDSWHEHWQSLRAGATTVIHHPQGFGVGNAGVTATRTHVKLLAGESTYTELGVETGLLGALVFGAWALLLMWRVLPRVAWIGASLAAIYALGLQTDVIGVPWVGYVLFALAGAALTCVETGET